MSGGDVERVATPAATPPNPVANVRVVERDAQGREICGARRRDGGVCRAPAAHGTGRCRLHGGASPQARRAARLRLAELVDPAIAVLAREMVKAEKSSDRIRAAAELLDRAGVGRHERHEVAVADARALLIDRLLQLREREQGELKS